MDERDGITHYVLVKSPGLVVSFSPVPSFLRQTLWKELARNVGKVPAGAVEVPLGRLGAVNRIFFWKFIVEICRNIISSLELLKTKMTAYFSPWKIHYLGVPQANPRITSSGEKEYGIPSVPRMRPNNGIQHYARVCSRCFILKTIEGIGITWDGLRPTITWLTTPGIGWKEDLHISTWKSFYTPLIFCG